MVPGKQNWVYQNIDVFNCIINLNNKMIFIFFTRSEVGKPNTLFCPEFKYVVSFLFLSGKVVKVTRG